MKAHENKLGLTEENMVEHILAIRKMGNTIISDDYIRPIIEKIVRDVMKDMVDTTDNKFWSIDDICLAIGRVLCEKLRIVI